MEEGFIPGERNKVVLVTIWVAGRPDPSFWTGTKIDGKEQHAVTAYRCPGCGWLDLYATGAVVDSMLGAREAARVSVGLGPPPRNETE